MRKHDDLKQAYMHVKCLPSCISPECEYAMSLCTYELSEKCKVGWWPANNQCLGVQISI